MDELPVLAEDPTLSVRTEVYLGLGREGPNVPSSAVQRFLRDDVTKVFPGATVIRARGWWEGVSEPARVVVIVHAPGVEGQIEALALRWCQRWEQSAVLVVSAPVRGALVAP